MYMMRQTIIVASRKIEYDLKMRFFIITKPSHLNFIKKIILVI